MSGCQKHVYERVVHTIHHYRMITSGDRILVGVSGGIDSVVLLYILHHLRARLGIEVCSAHLNHQFRGQEAVRDADFVRRFSEQLAVPCYTESRNVPEVMKQQKLSPQDAARQVRYQFFETLAREIGAQKIATAHTADDQAETLLIGLLRGVGTHGLGGVQPVLNGRIIRPLLTTTRNQIEEFAQAEHLEYVVDSSNTDRKYLRNAVRLDLLPMLQQHFNPSIVRRLAAYTQLFREDAAFIEQIATERFQVICKNVGETRKINLDLFANECITIQRELMYKTFESLTGTRQGLETRHVRAVIALFNRKAAGKQLSLPCKIVAYRSYEWGYLRKQREDSAHIVVSPLSIAVPGTTHFDRWRIETEITETIPARLTETRRSHGSEEVVQCLDYECLVAPLVVRYRLPGDAFRPLGMQGKKTIKKFFIDRKIPRDQRTSIPLLADANGIVWVVGLSIDDRVKITKTTRKVVICRVHALYDNSD